MTVIQRRLYFYIVVVGRVSFIQDREKGERFIVGNYYLGEEGGEGGEVIRKVLVDINKGNKKEKLER